MTARTHNTIIMHPNPHFRRSVKEALTRIGTTCLEVENWGDWISQRDTPKVTTVVVQIPPHDSSLGDRSVGDLHESLPGAAIIGLVSAGNVADTRRAFRAGAWDCLEEPIEPQVLVERVVEAQQQGNPPQRKHCGTDETGPWSRHSAFLETLAALRGTCQRHSQPLTIVMLDLDQFSDCNEQHSPAFGDLVLSWFAETLKGICRSSDAVTRYQGDRFIVALPDSTSRDAHEFARRCRHAMREKPAMIGDKPFNMTVSVGIAEGTAGFIESERQLIQRARIALEQAKTKESERTVGWSELLEDRLSRPVKKQLDVGGVNHWVERLRQHVRATCVESTRALVAAVEAKDPHTQAHSIAVVKYAELIGKRMQLSPRMIETLRVAALLHDVGKIGVPDAILTNPGPLNHEQFEIVKRHPQIALEILGHVSFLSDERPLILHHHERYDGTGYPAGLVGDNIPIGARILAVADAFDTMLSPRSYKSPYPIERVRAELVSHARRQFDPAVIAATLGWLDETPQEDFVASTRLRTVQKTVPGSLG